MQLKCPTPLQKQQFIPIQNIELHFRFIHRHIDRVEKSNINHIKHQLKQNRHEINNKSHYFTRMNDEKENKISQHLLWGA